MAITPIRRRIRVPFLLAAVAAWLASPAVPAQRLSGDELVGALQEGGYVLVMRNARSSEEPPAEGEEGPANVHGERELDRHGEGQMSALSYVFRELAIPVGETMTSPAYRSRQSGHYLGFGDRRSVPELAVPDEGGEPAWLEGHVSAAPPSGENTVIITHGSVIEAALGREARNIGTAETLVYRAHEGDAELVARMTAQEWAELAVD